MIISNKKKWSVYSVSSLYGTLLWGRQFAVQLRDRIVADHAENVEVDFQGITMVSRAYADEFLKVVHFFKTKGVIVESTNLSPEVKKMFQFLQKKLEDKSPEKS